MSGRIVVPIIWWQLSREVLKILYDVAKHGGLWEGWKIHSLFCGFSGSVSSRHLAEKLREGMGTMSWREPVRDEGEKGSGEMVTTPACRDGRLLEYESSCAGKLQRSVEAFGYAVGLVLMISFAILERALLLMFQFSFTILSIFVALWRAWSITIAEFSHRSLFLIVHISRRSLHLLLISIVRKASRNNALMSEAPAPESQNPNRLFR